MSFQNFSTFFIIRRSSLFLVYNNMATLWTCLRGKFFIFYMGCNSCQNYTTRGLRRTPYPKIAQPGDPINGFGSPYRSHVSIVPKLATVISKFLCVLFIIRRSTFDVFLVFTQHMATLWTCLPGKVLSFSIAQGSWR